MNNSEILALFDQEIRKDPKVVKGRVEVTPELIRTVYDDPKRKGFITYSELTAENAERIIEREIAYFRAIGRNLEWSTFEHDSLPDLHLRLEAHGFVVEEEPESIMVLDMERPPDKLVRPITADVRQIVDPAGLDDIFQVENRVWKTDFSWLKNKLGEDLVERPEGIAIYAAYVDDQPVSSAWVFFHHGTHFASLYGGSTLEAYRGRGLYTALVAARMNEAIKRGFRFLSIDAGSMSKPIVANLGFQLVTIGHECNLELADQ